MLSRTPPNSASKRCLERAFDDAVGDVTSSSSKKLNLTRVDDQHQGSFNNTSSRLESHVYESEIKSSIIKIANLEQQLMAERNDKTKLEIEFNSAKEKLSGEIKNLQEIKMQLEGALKSSKTNEKLISSEMEHLRNELVNLEKSKIPDRDKEIRMLRQQVQNLTDELKSGNFDQEKELRDIRFELETKQNQVDKLEIELARFEELKVSLAEVNVKLDEARKANTEVVNELRDARQENQNLKDNLADFNRYADQSNQIAEYEREMRKLNSEIEYLKAMQEKSHLYQEELESKSKQIQRYETKIVNIEVENSSLKARIKELEHLSVTAAEVKSNTNEQLKAALADLDAENSRIKEKHRVLNDEHRALKLEMSAKLSEIDELQKRLSRLITENNGRQRIIDIYDSEKRQSASESTGEERLLRKRVDELEQIIREYKKQLNETNELKMANNTSFQLGEEENTKSVEVQVNLIADVYASYEKKIASLSDELNELREKHDRLIAQTCDNELDKENVASARNNSDRIIELEQRLSEQVKYNQKYETEFKRKSSEVLRLIRLLLGYKVYFDEDEVKVASMTNPNEFFIFKVNLRENTISMRETNFAKMNSHLANVFIRDHRSFIGFLAAVRLSQDGLLLRVEYK